MARWWLALIAVLLAQLAQAAGNPAAWTFYKDGATERAPEATEEEEAEETEDVPSAEAAPPAVDDPPKVCLPDLNKWSFSSVAGSFFLNEATIQTIGNQRYIKIWTARLSNPETCEFEKTYVTVDCISRATGENYWDLTPVDPDDTMYEVVKDVCRSFPEKKAVPKKAPSRKR